MTAILINAVTSTSSVMSSSKAIRLPLNTVLPPTFSSHYCSVKGTDKPGKKSNNDSIQSWQVKLNDNCALKFNIMD